MKEVKPCPFCGGYAYVSRERYGKKFNVGCSNDNCLGFSGLGWLYDSEEDAAKAWNKRVCDRGGLLNLSKQISEFAMSDECPEELYERISDYAEAICLLCSETDK